MSNPQRNTDREVNPIDFRPILSSGTYAVGLYVQNELDEVVFTLAKEPKDVTARALCDAFALLSGHLTATKLGEHELAGFEGKDAFYSFLGDCET